MNEARVNGAVAGALERGVPPEPGPLRSFHFPAVQRLTLGNGIRLLVAEVPAFPVVTLQLLHEAGATREEPELAGLASLTLGLLDTGSSERSAAEIAEQIEMLGVQLDAGAAWDAAHAALTGLRAKLDPAAEILADVVLRPAFPQEEVERLRAERLAEILQRRADPRSLAVEAAARFVYSRETPFARPLGGVSDTVEGLTRQDVQRFHGEHFTPLDTHAIVVGDIDVDSAAELIERQFGNWTGAPPVRRSAETRARSTELQLVIVNRPGAVQSEIRVGHIGLARDTEDYFVVIVMNAILGGMFSSRLNLNLRERHGFTYGASSAFSMRRRPGSFMVSTAVQTEVTSAAIREILHELRSMREAAPDSAELSAARNYLAGVFPLRLQTTEGIANRLTELVLYDLPEDYFDTYRDRITRVSAQQVQEAAVRHVRPDEVAIVVVGDAEQLAGPLQALEVGMPRVVEVTEIDSV